MSSGRLDIDYGTHAPVEHLVDVLLFVTEGVSLDFTRYDEPLIRGPGLYFAVVSGQSIGEFADPMGTNKWPVSACDRIDRNVDDLYTATKGVAFSRDGGVVVTVDGTILEQMVRFRDVVPGEDTPIERTDEYATWMGSRHMSALDVSCRADVVATITLSEESGRVTVFRDGGYTTFERSEVGGPWRTSE